MARVTLLSEFDSPDLAPLSERIRGGRGTMLNLYRALLMAPAIAETWLDHIGAIRWQTSLAGDLREIMIIRIAQITGTEYAMRQHVPKLALAEGLSLEKCGKIEFWRDSDLFSPVERAALAFAEAMTISVKVEDEEFLPLRSYFDDKQLVELTVLIASYNMHNRFVRALEIDLEQP